MLGFPQVMSRRYISLLDMGCPADYGRLEIKRAAVHGRDFPDHQRQVSQCLAEDCFEPSGAVLSGEVTPLGHDSMDCLISGKV